MSNHLRVSIVDRPSLCSRALRQTMMEQMGLQCEHYTPDDLSSFVAELPGLQDKENTCVCLLNFHWKSVQDFLHEMVSCAAEWAYPDNFFLALYKSPEGAGIPRE